MKTLVFRNAANTTRAEVKADIVAKNSEMIDPSFDTKFTAMDIADTDAAIQTGINVNEIDYSFKSLVTMANSLAGIGLFAIDINEGALAAVAQVDTIKIAGSSGTATITIDGTNYTATFATDNPTTASNFVTAEAANISSAHNITVTANNGVLTFTADNAGTAFVLSIANATGDLDGTLTNVTNNQSGAGEITIIPTHHPVS